MGGFQYPGLSPVLRPPLPRGFFLRFCRRFVRPIAKSSDSSTEGHESKGRGPKLIVSLSVLTIGKPILKSVNPASNEQHPAFVAELNLMAIINGLIVAVFLILVTASVAVVGSMIVLTLFDLALSRKRPSGTTAVIDSDPEITNRFNLEMAFSNWRRERGVTEED
jgi:hypothetical protein